MIQIDTGQIRALEQDLWLLSKKAAPYANTFALNKMAFQSQQGARQTVRDDFVNRNAFTVRSIQVDKARLGPIGKAYSVVGSTAAYMEDQEFGGTKNTRGAHGTPIATKEASGEGRGGGVRKRMPRAKNTIRALTLTKRGKRIQNKRQRNAMAITTAIRGGGGVVFLDLGVRKGLFRVSGTRKSANITMLHDLSRRVITIPRNPWLYPAVRFASMLGREFYFNALQDQIKRQKLFRNR